MQNHGNCRGAWFRLRCWETGLYRRLQVKNWKDRMPTYAPETFDGSRHSLEEIAQVMCQAEVVHEVIAVFSFLPLLAAAFNLSLAIISEV